MANHKSSIKRIRSNEKKKLTNRYSHKTTRNALKKLRGTTDKTAAASLLVEVTSLLDKLAKKNVIHKNKAGNLVGKVTRHVNALK
jgi:small subunit ribosomal protein S20